MSNETKSEIKVGDRVRVCAAKGTGQVYTVEHIGNGLVRASNENATLTYRPERFEVVADAA